VSALLSLYQWSLSRKPASAGGNSPSWSRSRSCQFHKAIR